TFKCGTDNFFCGNEVDGTLCNDGAKEILEISSSECDALIAAVNTDGVDPYKTKCPNGRAISHYVIYDCRGTSGTKYELDKDGKEIAVTCSRRKLRGSGLFSFS
ncbi:MAG: hypothetical protein IBX70_14475, partial [Clostridia bacterium]|nr:hypothetical protein [Clostridia bacterium]